MSYWTDRVNDLKKWMEKNEEKTKKKLSSYYDREWSRLDREIASYYAKYGTDNVIEYRNMMQKLSDDDIKLLMEKMDDFADKYPQYAHLMPVRESIYQLNRLEGLQYSITLQQLEMGAITNEEVTDYLNDLAVKGLNMSSEVMGFGKNFYSVNSDIVKQFVNTAWCNGENFSQRIWGNSEKLSSYLRNDIAQGFARGDSYEKLTKELRRRFSNVSRNDAYRVIYTEGTYVMAESSMQPFTDDFEQYRILTAEDSKVCPVCRAMAEKVFNISERQAGTNFPPFHPWCRCTFEIVVDDWDAWMDKYVEKHSDSEKDAETISDHFTDANDQARYGKNSERIGTNNVDLDYIKSDEFSHKFNKLTSNSKVNDQIRKYSRSILTHRKGTDFEDLYIINSETGELLFRKIDSESELAVGTSPEEIDGLKNMFYGKMIGIHNHPTNILPTGSDFVAAGYRGYKFGIVITHDGRIFKYSCGNIPFRPETLDNRIDKYLDVRYNLSKEEAHIRALNEFRKEYGIEWMEIKN